MPFRWIRVRCWESVRAPRLTRFRRLTMRNRKSITPTWAVTNGRFAWLQGRMKSSRGQRPHTHLKPGKIGGGAAQFHLGNNDGPGLGVLPSVGPIPRLPAGRVLVRRHRMVGLHVLMGTRRKSRVQHHRTGENSVRNRMSYAVSTSSWCGPGMSGIPQAGSHRRKKRTTRR